MKRYFAHYTFVYPDTFLESQVVEMDDSGKISCWYAYEKEIPHTEFHSGLQVFIPRHLTGSIFLKDVIKLDSRLMLFHEEDILIRSFLV